MKAQTAEQNSSRLLSPYPITKRRWACCLIVGVILWITGLLLWQQQTVDEGLLLYFNPARVSDSNLVIIAQWFSDYGREVIVAIYLVYMLDSYRRNVLEVPRSIHLVTLTSWVLSGLATTLLKLVFARPRPLMTFGDQVHVLTEYVTYAMPSGHATTSAALVLPFLLLVPDKNPINQSVKVLISLLAMGVAASRVVLGAHYLGDVIAGIGVAFIGLPFAVLLANQIMENVNTK